MPAPVPQPAKSATQTPAPNTPAVLPLPAPKEPEKEAAERVHNTRFSRRAAAVIPWAIAATVLLAIPGTVVPVLDIYNRADSAGRDAELAQRDVDAAASAVRIAKDESARGLNAAQDRLTAAQQAELALLNQWTKALKEAARTATEPKLAVDVRKPVTIQPGAPNDFLVVVREQPPGLGDAPGKNSGPKSTPLTPATRSSFANRSITRARATPTPCTYPPRRGRR